VDDGGVQVDDAPPGQGALDKHAVCFRQELAGERDKSKTRANGPAKLRKCICLTVYNTISPLKLIIPYGIIN
jgi:hypothetical protein